MDTFQENAPFWLISLYTPSADPRMVSDLRFLEGVCPVLVGRAPFTLHRNERRHDIGDRI